MSDDRVQYSELNHCETNDPVTDVAKVCEPGIVVNMCKTISLKPSANNYCSHRQSS